MSAYKSNPVTVFAAAPAVFATLSEPAKLRELLDNVPADKIPEESRAQLDKIRIEGDSISVDGGPTGSITLQITERRAPDLIRFQGVGLPVSLSLDFIITPETESECSVTVELDADIPKMLRPMVGGALQKAADQMASTIARISFDRLNQ